MTDPGEALPLSNPRFEAVRVLCEIHSGFDEIEFITLAEADGTTGPWP